jgi:flagellar motor switch protein FliG
MIESASAQLSGAQKAAILMLSLGTENSSKVMALLGEGEVTQITAEIVKAGQISREESTSTLEEFATLLVAGGRVANGGPEAARGMLEASLGSERAAAILEGLYQSMVKGPFDFLKNADPRQILNFLSAEHPQTIALVVAHAHPDIAAQVVGGLPEDVQRAVSVRIAMLEPSSPEVIAQVEAMLERRLSSSVKNQETRVADGVQTLIEILNRSDRATERSIFEGLDDHNGELADEVRSRMFVFEDIVTLDDRSVQLVLRQVEAKELATALKGVKQEVRDKIMRNMSERAAQNLGEDEDRRRVAGWHRACHPRPRGERPDRHHPRRRRIRELTRSGQDSTTGRVLGESPTGHPPTFVTAPGNPDDCRQGATGMAPPVSMDRHRVRTQELHVRRRTRVETRVLRHLAHRA